MPIQTEVGDKPIRLLERLIVACLSAFIVTLMASCTPLALLLFARGHWIADIIGLYKTFPIWGGTVAGTAALTGFALGEARMLIAFSHLWATATPRRSGLTLALWLALIAIGAAAVWLWQDR